MVTFSKPISAGQAQAYHKEEFANAKENYYTEGERVRGEWQGQLATRFRFDQRGPRGAVCPTLRRPAAGDWRATCAALDGA
jgi:hypothetical protein